MPGTPGCRRSCGDCPASRPVPRSKPRGSPVRLSGSRSRPWGLAGQARVNYDSEAPLGSYSSWWLQEPPEFAAPAAPLIVEQMYYLLLRSATDTCQSRSQGRNSWIFGSDSFGIGSGTLKCQVSGLMGLTGSGRSGAVLPGQIPEAAACGGKPERSEAGAVFFYLVVLIVYSSRGRTAMIIGLRYGAGSGVAYW